jgi:hypothetical protein
MNRTFLASISNNCTANVEYQLKNPMGDGELATIPASACVTSVFIYTNNPITNGCKFILGNLDEKENYIPASMNINTTMLNEGRFINRLVPHDEASPDELPIVITFDHDFTDGEICFLFSIISI